MRAVSIALLLMLAGCGGSESALSQGENVALAPEALQQKPTATGVAGVDFGKPVRAFGTEPYWALDITPEKIRFEDFGVEDSAAVDWAPAKPKVTGIVAVIETRTKAGDPVTVTLSGESCLEVGGEANTLPLKAVVKIGSRTLTGCAGERLPDPGTPEAANAANESTA